MTGHPGQPRPPAFGGPLPWLALAAVLGAATYLLAARRAIGFGFPLDDAWIHQTYARNLAAAGRWEFVPGQPSAGSTSPLWTALLALGYRLGLDYRLWTTALGLGLLILLGWLTFRLAGTLYPGPADCARGPALLAGLAVVLEWHLLWAALSGMETLLLACFAVAALWAVAARWRFPGLLGLLIGASAWARPDGLTLLPVAALGVALATRREYTGHLRYQFHAAGVRLLALSLGFGFPFALYLGFNRALGGGWWPNTFYAKQAEYAALLAAPFLLRFLRLWAPLLAGGLVLLLPGWLLVAGGWQLAVGGRRPAIGGWRPSSFFLLPAKRSSFLPLLWAAAYVGLYALRLPLTYQHGRYVLPALPVLLAYAVAGVARRVGWRYPHARQRVGARVWWGSVVAVWLGFVALGAGAYARDVGIIQTEMVATARWLAANTPPGARIAAHDVGAIGYYSGRPLLDMAGLVSPEVIPFIRDEARLAAWLEAQGADYVATFPEWYPLLAARGAPVVYRSGGRFSPAAGGGNMEVWRWRRMGG